MKRTRPIVSLALAACMLATPLTLTTPSRAFADPPDEPTLTVQDGISICLNVEDDYAKPFTDEQGYRVGFSTNSTSHDSVRWAVYAAEENSDGLLLHISEDLSAECLTFADEQATINIAQIYDAYLTETECPWVDVIANLMNGDEVIASQELVLPLQRPYANPNIGYCCGDVNRLVLGEETSTEVAFEPIIYDAEHQWGESVEATITQVSSTDDSVVTGYVDQLSGQCTMVAQDLGSATLTFTYECADNPQYNGSFDADFEVVAQDYSLDVQPDNGIRNVLRGTDFSCTVDLSNRVWDEEAQGINYSNSLSDGHTIEYAIAEDRISPEGSTVTQDADDPLRFTVHAPDQADEGADIYVAITIRDANGQTVYQANITAGTIRSSYLAYQLEDADGNVIEDVTLASGETTATVYPKLYRVSAEGRSEVSGAIWDIAGWDHGIDVIATDDGGFELSFTNDEQNSASFSLRYEADGESDQTPWYWFYREGNGQNTCDEHDWQIQVTSWPSEDEPGALTKTCSVCGETETIELWAPVGGTSYIATKDAAFTQLFGQLFRNNLGNIEGASASNIVTFTRHFYNIEKDLDQPVCLSYQEFLDDVDSLFATHESVEDYLAANEDVFVDKDADALVFLNSADYLGVSGYLHLKTQVLTDDGRILYAQWHLNPSSKQPEGTEGVDYAKQSYSYEEDGEPKTGYIYYTIGDHVRIVLNGTHQIAAYELDVKEDLAEVAKIDSKREDQSEYIFLYPAGGTVTPANIVAFLMPCRKDDGTPIPTCSVDVEETGEYTRRVTYTGTGSYTGSLTVDIRIAPITVKVADVPFQRIGPLAGKGYETVTALVDGEERQLTYGTDYGCSYEGNMMIGDGKLLTIWGLGTYYCAPGLLSYSYRMVGDIAQTTVSVNALTYTGRNLAPKVSVVWKKDYAYSSMNAPVKGTDYTVTYKNSAGKAVAAPKNAGKYTATIKGKGLCVGSVSKTFTVAKATNTLRASGKKANVKYAKVTKAKQTIKRTNAITVKTAQGAITYKKTSGNANISINKSTGAITIKKGLGKGTYKVKIEVKAAGNSNYKPATKTVAVTIKVS